MRRFGPSPMCYVAFLAGLALVIAFFLTGTRFWGLPAAGILVLLATVPGWNWYDLDAEGIHRWGLKGARFVPWEAVDAVIGRRAESYRGPSTTQYSSGSTVLTQFVVDARGRTLLRLDPWIFYRRQMVRLILATVSARRKEEVPRDE